MHVYQIACPEPVVRYGWRVTDFDLNDGRYPFSSAVWKLASGPHYCKGKVEATLLGIGLSREFVLQGAVDSSSQWAVSEKREGIKWRYFDSFSISEPTNHLVVSSRGLGLTVCIPFIDEPDRAAWLYMVEEQGLSDDGKRLFHFIEVLGV